MLWVQGVVNQKWNERMDEEFEEVEEEGQIFDEAQEEEQQKSSQENRRMKMFHRIQREKKKSQKATRKENHHHFESEVRRLGLKKNSWLWKVIFRFHGGRRRHNHNECVCQ